MKKLLTLLALGMSLTVGVAHAADAAAAPATQQNKMKSCNADPKAKELKGDDRKAFMKECLNLRIIVSRRNWSPFVMKKMLLYLTS